MTQDTRLRYDGLDVDVVVATTDGVLARYRHETLTATLSHGERARYDAFRVPRAAADFLGARALAREVVARCAGLRPEDLRLSQQCAKCGRDGHGPPRVVDVPMWVSWSHSAGRLAVAVSATGRVGVDIEPLDRFSPGPGLLRSAFGPEEAARIAASVDPRREFATAWTLKEAFVKANPGTSTWAPPAGVARTTEEGAGGWVTEVTGDLALAVAVARPAGRLFAMPNGGDASEVLRDLWADKLGLDTIGDHDDFFALGGDSFLALEVMIDMREQLGSRISVADFFDGPTISEVALKLRPET